MTNKETVKLSKFLSLVLRHEPGRIGLALDEADWADVGDLMARAAHVPVAFIEFPRLEIR